MKLQYFFLAFLAINCAVGLGYSIEPRLPGIEEIFNSLAKLVNTLKSALSEGVTTIKNITTGVIDKIIKKVDEIAPVIAGLLKESQDYAKDIQEKVAAKISEIDEIIECAIMAVGTASDETINKIKEIAEELINEITKCLTNGQEKYEQIKHKPLEVLKLIAELALDLGKLTPKVPVAVLKITGCIGGLTGKVASIFANMTADCIACIADIRKTMDDASTTTSTSTTTTETTTLETTTPETTTVETTPETTTPENTSSEGTTSTSEVPTEIPSTTETPVEQWRLIEV